MGDFSIDLKAIIAILAVITTVVLAYLVNWWRNKKELSYETRSSFPLFSVGDSDGFRDDFKLAYRGREVEVLYASIVDIVNTGRQPILKSDFDTALNILFEGSEILSAEVLKSGPRNLLPSISFDMDHVAIEPIMLNGKDWFQVRVLSTGHVSDIDVAARIVGIPTIKEYKRGYTPRIATYGMIAFFGVVAVTGMFLAGREHFRSLNEGMKYAKGEGPPPTPENSSYLIGALVSFVLAIACMQLFLWATRRPHEE